MDFKKRGVLILWAVCLGCTAYAQDTLKVSGGLDDTLSLRQSVVTAQSREQRIREGAYAVSALNISIQASTLNSLSSAIDRLSGIGPVTFFSPLAGDPLPDADFCTYLAATPNASPANCRRGETLWSSCAIMPKPEAVSWLNAAA